MNQFLKEHWPVIFAVIAAVIAACNPALSKLVVGEVDPVMSAAFLNIGSGIGIAIIALFALKTPLMKKEGRVRKNDLPCIFALSLCEMLGAICMMVGLSLTSASNASLLGNFETVFIAIFAFFLFKEMGTKRLWLAVVLITVGSFILSVEDFSTFSFSLGSLFVLGACAFWGLEINLMKRVSSRNPTEILIIKGITAGIGCLIIALIKGEVLPSVSWILIVMLLGLFAYGLAFIFLIYSQRELGAGKSGIIYGVSPFIAAALSCIIFREIPEIPFLISFVLMALGFYFAVTTGKRKKSNGKDIIE